MAAVGIVKVKSKNKLLAIIIKARFKCSGIKFFVPDKFPQQLGYMKRSKGYVIASHSHRQFPRLIKSTQEVLFIRSGKVRVDFYSGEKHYIESRVVGRGDVIFLASGGHGFEFMQDSEIIEVKQGPYLQDIQQTRFEAVKKNKLKIKK